MSAANIFVLGLDEANVKTLERLPGEYEFHPLLDPDRLLNVAELDLPALLDEAEQQLAGFEGSVDAIVGYWDFPVSSMVPILCERRGLSSPNLEAVVKCEHKYWSRLEQQRVIEEHPRFAILELDEQEVLPAGVEFPVWLKPVKSASSVLAFLVKDQAGLESAMAEIRAGVGRFARPFEFVMDQVDLPAEIESMGAMACVAEEEATGQQVTVEGYEFGGRIEVYGIVDSVTYPDSASFLRYEYPSRLPDQVRERVTTSAKKVIEQVGLESSTFNVEYFWDTDTDTIRLLEVNPRLSQSHAELFEMVDGLANHEAMVRMALGRAPDLPHREGDYAVAAKWFLRRFDDGVVVRSPNTEEVEKVEHEVPGTVIHPVAERGVRLSDLAQQDSYSFELATLYIGARDEQELVEKYERCVEMLPFEVDE